ncbi:MAG: hypothetical protein UY18_C0022G0011 [Microgenomates group bacterium GW2011_GWF2_47_9]|nr:MAG: hypothetical protein UY18_C0022G0011 [Microgenomates group bacterium GW2011_GWF2_47_9]
MTERDGGREGSTEARTGEIYHEMIEEWGRFYSGLFQYTHQAKEQATEQERDGLGRYREEYEGMLGTIGDILKGIEGGWGTVRFMGGTGNMQSRMIAMSPEKGVFLPGFLYFHWAGPPPLRGTGKKRVEMGYRFHYLDAPISPGKDDPLVRWLAAAQGALHPSIGYKAGRAGDPKTSRTFSWVYRGGDDQLNREEYHAVWHEMMRRMKPGRLGK